MNYVNKEPFVKAKNSFGFLFDPSNGFLIFMSAVGLVYGLIPLIVVIFFDGNYAFEKLSLITFVGLISMLVGAKISIFDFRFSNYSTRFKISPKFFISINFSIFIFFLIVTFVTAPSIPILSAVGGVDSNELSNQRGAFLKGREGAGIVLLYVSTFLSTTVIPYSIILLYERKSSARYWATFLFFLFCISFMQKTLFLNCILPLLAFFAYEKKLGKKVFLLFLGGSFILILLATILSLHGEQMDGFLSRGEYFSASYSPGSPFEYFLWRAIAVPVFTAADTLIVHAEQFQGDNLFGATSSLIAGFFGLERINIERYVFQYQFGSWNEIANSNAFYLIDAFVNFGWLGVVFFGVFVGQVFRWFRISKDVAFRSLWPIFAVILFSAPLIGMLLSNGFAYMLFHALFIRVQKYENAK